MMMMATKKKALTYLRPQIFIDEDRDQNECLMEVGSIINSKIIDLDKHIRRRPMGWWVQLKLRHKT